MTVPVIDNNRDIDWGKTSGDYSKYRDIYPDEFYQRLECFGIGLKLQTLLDIGTGTGVIPRRLSANGAKFFGTDISEEQINAAAQLSKYQKLNIEWKVCPAEKTGLPDHFFDIVTACQCWWYFDKSKLIPEIVRLLKPRGKLSLMYMNWLPFEDEIAGKTEELVLKYNPDWKGNGFKGNIFSVPSWSDNIFELDTYHKFRVHVPFTRNSWCGRIRACRGIGASLTKKDVTEFDREHEYMLRKIAPESFKILHEAWFEIYRLIH